MENYTIIIPSHIPEYGEKAQKSLLPLKSRIFDGSDYGKNSSFSKLMNDCILSCPTEIVIICNHKMRAQKKDIDKILEMVQKGFGLVCLHSFWFFGFKKELIRRIGFFDERFIGGGYEDIDFMRRVQEEDIAVFQMEYTETMYSKESPNLSRKSSWDSTEGEKFNDLKWRELGHKSIRLLGEEDYSHYDIGESTGNTFLPYEKSIITTHAAKEFLV